MDDEYFIDKVMKQQLDKIKNAVIKKDRDYVSFEEFVDSIDHNSVYITTYQRAVDKQE